MKVKVGEERGGPWSDIDGYQLSLPETQIFTTETEIFQNKKTLYPKSDKVLYIILFQHNTYDRDNIYIGLEKKRNLAVLAEILGF